LATVARLIYQILEGTLILTIATGSAQPDRAARMANGDAPMERRTT